MGFCAFIEYRLSISLLSVVALSNIAVACNEATLKRSATHESTTAVYGCGRYNETRFAIPHRTYVRVYISYAKYMVRATQIPKLFPFYDNSYFQVSR